MATEEGIMSSILIGIHSRESSLLKQYVFQQTYQVVCLRYLEQTLTRAQSCENVTDIYVNITISCATKTDLKWWLRACLDQMLYSAIIQNQNGWRTKLLQVNCFWQQ